MGQVLGHIKVLCLLSRIFCSVLLILPPTPPPTTPNPVPGVILGAGCPGFEFTSDAAAVVAAVVVAVAVAAAAAQPGPFSIILRCSSSSSQGNFTICERAGRESIYSEDLSKSEQPPPEASQGLYGVTHQVKSSKAVMLETSKFFK